MVARPASKRASERETWRKRSRSRFDGERNLASRWRFGQVDTFEMEMAGDLHQGPAGGGIQSCRSVRELQRSSWPRTDSGWVVLRRSDTNWIVKPTIYGFAPKKRSS
jgi:hypothetical protein